MSPTKQPRAAVSRTQQIENIVRRFLAEFHPQGKRGMRAIASTANLWREVSSLTLLQLVAFIEERFAIVVRPIDFAPQHFQTLETIAKYIASARTGDEAGVIPRST